MSEIVEFNQELVDRYFSNWIGISTKNSEKNEPSVLGLYFPDFKLASKSHLLLNEWQKWMPEDNLVFSVVQENEHTYSFYFYKKNRKEFVKGTFDHNLDIDELKIFLKNEKNRMFAILARFPDNANNIVDNPSQNIISLKGLSFSYRRDLTSNDLEYNQAQ